jgi:hypothetical protein
MIDLILAQSVKLALSKQKLCLRFVEGKATKPLKCFVLSYAQGFLGQKFFPPLSSCTFELLSPSFAHGKLHSLGNIGVQALA